MLPKLTRRRQAGLAAATVGVLAAALAAAPAASADPPGWVHHQSPVKASSPSVPTPPAVSWTACDGSTFPTVKGAQCAYVTVPLDYDDRSQGTIKVAISRVQHTSTTYKGVILVNPGGPGGSGIGLSTLGADVPDGVGDEYDWIGFDPRGVGASVPSVHCDAGFFGYDRPDYVATTAALQKVWLDREAAYSQSCASANDLRLLNNLTTVDNAKDMESIRLALGQKKISYYGFSYGTYLGQVYATLFPSHLARAVLDSNVDPRDVWYASNNAQDVAFTTTTKAFFAWVASHDDTYGLGSSEAQVEALYYGVLDQLRRTPQNDGKVGPDEWTDAFTPAGYYQLTWTSVADIFEAAVKDGDYSGVTDSIEGPTDDDNGFAIYAATECTDAASPTSYAKTWKPDALRIAKDNPFLTWSNVWYDAECLTWPAHPQTPVAIDGSKAPPILLVDEQYDAATPIAGTFEVRSLFPKSSMIEVVGGTSHAVTLLGNACTDDRIAAYLNDGTLPARTSGSGPDATCQPLPLPTPDAASARARTGAVRAGVLPGRL